MFRPSASLPMVAALLLAGCASPPAPPDTTAATRATPDAAALPRPVPPSLTIDGALSYRERVALPPDTLVVVELREAAAFGGRIVAERHFAADGRQVPLPFVLELARGRIAADRDYVVRGGLVADSRPLWTSDATPVSGAALAAAGRLDVGTLWMAAVQASPSGTVMWCGGVRIAVRFDDAGAVLHSGGRQWSLTRQPSASGARYVAADDPTTIWWNKGERAQLTIAGRDHPECRLAVPDQPFLRALGNEPGWLLELGDDTAMLVTDYGRQRVALPVAITASSATHTLHVGRDAGRRIAVAVHDRPCTDTMSGAVFPYTVEIELDGTRHTGCGGLPASVPHGT
jgi:uncharacterized lipoprotein YbaY/uncharacterized membrane protein